METIVVNIDDRKQEYDVYIGTARQGKGIDDGYFANPYPLDRNNRLQTIEKFKEYFHNKIMSDPIYVERIMSLKGKRLGCTCAPKPCHGDVIAEYLNNLDNALF